MIRTTRSTLAPCAPRRTSTPTTPGALASPNRIDPDFSSDNDYEVVARPRPRAGPRPRGGRGLHLATNIDTYLRHLDVNWTPRIGVTTADYSLGAPVTRNGYTVTPYILNAGRHAPGRASPAADPDQPARLLPPVQRPRAHPQQAALQPLDGAASPSPTWTGRTSSTSPLGHFPNPNPIDLDPGLDGGQVIRQGVGLGQGPLHRRQVAAGGERALPAPLELRDRHQHLHPPGLPAAVLHPGQHRRLRGHDERPGRAGHRRRAAGQTSSTWTFGWPRTSASAAGPT